MSLTIQAPHANMNAYEIGDDETRKNKVSDKGTIYAGDLQFAQTTGNAASDKKQSARKQAMKLIRDAWDSDNKAVSQRDQIAQQKEEKRKEVRACNEELKQIRESKEIARQSYGVDSDSQEQKDLELLDASDKDAFGMLIQDAVDHIDEKQEEEKEKAEEAQEKRDEQQEKIDEKKEEKQQQEKMIEGSVEADRLEADVTVDQTGTSKLEEAQQHIQTILKKNNLVNEDLKGIKIDLNF